jgi:nitrogen fixation/metabolism regulation signal transduction histidine kinase
MIYRRFRIQVALRVIAIAATITLAMVLVMRTTSYVAVGILGLIVVYQSVSLVRYVEKTNHDLSRLLRSIRYSDFAQSFTGSGRGGSFKELGAAFRSVMEDFRDARAEKEEGYRYLQTVMQHVGIGLLSFKHDGSVNLINNAAKRLLRVPFLRNVQTLDFLSPKLVETLMTLKAGEKTLIKVVDDDELLQLVIYATEFKLREELYKLVSIQDIQSELEEKEIEAWQKLTRVLTHEIMNSVAPIASLASTARGLLEEAEETTAAEADSPMDSPVASAVEIERAGTLQDVRDAVRTIERRSGGLLNFVQAYRRLTRVPRPDFKIFPAVELFDAVSELMEPDLRARGIHFERTVRPASLDLTADPELIEQVLINLVKNAGQAVDGVEDPRVTMNARIDSRGRAVIKVSDNGTGIVEEAMDKIFVPFFTTKKDGSGIGLSLSREIMRQHGGTLSVYSSPGEQTTFTLRF